MLTRPDGLQLVTERIINLRRFGRHLSAVCPEFESETHRSGAGYSVVFVVSVEPRDRPPAPLARWQPVVAANG